MATKLTYLKLIKATRGLAKKIRRDTDAHRKLANDMHQRSKETGRLADQIAALHVDAATVAETRDLADQMQHMAGAALSYATAAFEASRLAVAAEQQATQNHAGIQEARDKSPVPMADRGWYTQE